MIIYFVLKSSNNLEKSIPSRCLESLREYSSNPQNMKKLVEIADEMERLNFEGFTYYSYGKKKIVIEKYSGNSLDSLLVLPLLNEKTIFEINRDSENLLFSGCKRAWKYDVGILYYTNSNSYVDSFKIIEKLKAANKNGRWSIVARKSPHSN